VGAVLAGAGLALNLLGAFVLARSPLVIVDATAQPSVYEYLYQATGFPRRVTGSVRVVRNRDWLVDWFIIIFGYALQIAAVVCSSVVARSQD